MTVARLPLTVNEREDAVPPGDRRAAAWPVRWRIDCNNPAEKR
ncbi:MAG: hypothetical protein ABR561_06490 [Guyparkeria sp.]